MGRTIGAVTARLYEDERITAFGLLAETYAGLVSRIATQLSGHGLALVEFEVLIRLARSPRHRLRMTELATQVALTTSGITRVVDRLERDQLVHREACPSDRRGAWAVVTDLGLARLAAALPGHLTLLEEHFTGHFSTTELELITARLREIRDEVHPGARPRSPRARAAQSLQQVSGKTSGRNAAPTPRSAEVTGETVTAHG